jgi:hypothetical protein
MKYIKLYEAFKATILSKMNSYLKSVGISDKNKSKFLEDLNKIFSSYGVPIDKIENSDIIYKSRNELYPIKSKEFENEFGIYGIKFWFSKDGEYLGKTAIGNYKQSEMSSDEKNILPEELLEKIRNGFLGDRYKTGNLTPVNKDLDSYSQLSTGMKVIAYLYESTWGYEYDGNDFNRWVDPLTAGVIYRSGDKIFIIHENVEADGNYPSGDRDAGQYGDYGWGIADVTRVYNDHYFLSIYEPSDKPLDFIYNNGEEKVVSDDPDIFNLDLTNDGNVTRFKTKNFNKIKNDADFGIFINLDSILKRGGYENTKEIISKRQTAKSGIIGGPHGLSNDELKEINIKRYADLLITRYGISSEGVDFDKLNIFLANLLTEWFLFDLIGSRNIIFTNVRNLINVICNLLLAIRDNRGESVEQCFNNVINYINRIKNAKKEFIKLDSRIYEILEENEKFGNLLLSIKEMGKELVDKLKSNKLDNLYSLELLNRKYATLSDHFRVSYDNDTQKMCRLVTNFLYTDIDYTEDWDGLSTIDFDKCQDIVKSIRVIL